MQQKSRLNRLGKEIVILINLFPALVPIGFALIAQNAAALEPAKFEIPRSEVHELHSTALGRTYELYIKKPSGYDEPEHQEQVYPVIYLLDGHDTFQVASGATQLPMRAGKIENAILVGISFAQGEDAIRSRIRDLTPHVDESWPFETGGAPAYLEFIEQEVFAHVETNFRGDPEARTLAGHSLGGLFGAWVLVTRPELFDQYILASPSLWFFDKIIFDLEEIYAQNHDELRAQVYFATGSLERPGVSSRDDMVGDQQEFVDQLRARGYGGLDIRDEIIPEASHVMTFPIGFTHGIHWLFAKDGEQQR